MVRRRSKPVPDDTGPMARKIDQENRVALPPIVRSFLGVETGGHVAFEIEGGRVVLHAAEVSRVVKVKRRG